jgi:hypothetical protein
LYHIFLENMFDSNDFYSLLDVRTLETCYHHIIIGICLFELMTFVACWRPKQYHVRGRPCSEDSKENSQPKEVPRANRQQHLQGGCPCHS